MSVLEASLLRIRADLPGVNEVFLHSDNAGCYHNAQVILGLPGLGQSTGFNIRTNDYAEAQAGKDICEPKIAPMKSHVE